MWRCGIEESWANGLFPSPSSNLVWVIFDAYVWLIELA
jgi:hypothetical protein